MSELTQQALADRGQPNVAGANAATAAALENVPTSSAPPVDDPESDVAADQALPEPVADAADSDPSLEDPSSDPLIDALRAQNLDVEGYTSEQFLADVGHTFNENQELRARVQQLEARITSGSPASGAAEGASPELPSAASSTPAPESAPWSPVKFDRRLLQFLERDPETQQVRVVTGGDPAILRQYHEWQNWRQELADRWEENPGEFIRPFVESIVRPLIAQAGTGIEQKMQAEVRAQREQSILDRTLVENGYVATNTDGTIRRHPVTGQPLQTPEGTAFLKELRSLVQDKIPQSRAIEIAVRLHPGKPRSGSRPTSAAPAATAPASTSATQVPSPRKTIGDRMRGATRTPGVARNRAVDFADEDRVPSMEEIQRQQLARS